MLSYSLGQIAEIIGADLQGDPDVIVTGIGTLQEGNSSTITFFDNPRYQPFLATTQAAAVILRKDKVELCQSNKLIIANPYLAYARVAMLFDTAPAIAEGIHATAIIAEDAKIDPSASVGPCAVIAAGVRIEKNAQIGAGAYIGHGSVIGEESCIMPNVVIYHHVRIGKRCRIHGGVVIGADGFGIAKSDNGWTRIPQIGGVVIGDDVDIGANTTIDRGAINDTIIGNGVKLDNQIQIGHNAIIGDHTAIAAGTAVAGSAKIGKHCVIGGCAGVGGHLELGDNVCLTAFTGVNNDILEPGVYSSGLLPDTRESWRKNAVRFKQLDKMARRIAALEKALLTQDNER